MNAASAANAATDRADSTIEAGAEEVGRIHGVVILGTALLMGIILGNVVYFWKRSERIDMYLERLKRERLERDKEKAEENEKTAPGRLALSAVCLHKTVNADLVCKAVA